MDAHPLEGVPLSALAWIKKGVRVQMESEFAQPVQHTQRTEWAGDLLMIPRERCTPLGGCVIISAGLD